MRRLISILALGAAFSTSATGALADGSTQPASDITFNSAKLNATVDVGDTVHFQYGTTSLSLSTPLATATNTSYSRTISGLTPGTTYRFRIVTDDNTGSERTFTTDSAPSASTGATDMITTSSGRISGTVDPNGALTEYRFEWGTSSNLGRFTPKASAGDGVGETPVAAVLAGLTPNKRYYYRVTATNAAGTVRGSTRSFVTGKILTGLTIAVEPSYLRYAATAAISGQLTGSGVGGVTLALEYQVFPFSEPFKELKTTRTTSGGSYRITVPALLQSTNIRVVARSTPAISSQTRLLHSRPIVGINVRRGARRLVFRGVMWPAMPSGIVRIQRRSPRGKWVTVRRGSVSVRDANRSAYRLSVKRRSGVYRALVNPRDGGAHAAGYSRVRVVR